VFEQTGLSFKDVGEEGVMRESILSSRLAANWGWVVARGVAGIIFGVLALAWPGPTFMSLLMLFAVFAFFEGVANVISAVAGGRAGEPMWGTLLVEGLISIALAVAAVLAPTTMAVVLVWIIGLWAIVTGALRIGAAVRLRRLIEHEWLLGLSGLAAIGFGLLLLFRPAVGALAMLWWLGAYEVVFGIMLLAVGLRLRSERRHHEHGGRPPIAARDARQTI
jgi:uncharacterized membrane protein HdeD (DUF308 family)